MSKPSKSQWDFGELFPPEQTRRVLSVAGLTAQIKCLLEKQVGLVWVGGEITNLRTQSSGHIYFTLKDASAQLSCVLFRGEAVPHRGMLADGRRVLLQGDVTVYEARGQYQMIVRAAELQGVGALQAAFEKLKQKLAAEGVFSPERKRPLPKFPRRIGLVTSPTGAAIRDVLHVARRRNPALEIFLAPCRVQGDGAAAEIAGAIRLLNEFNSTPGAHHEPLDLILVTRGGGSLEDLWAFNEEQVARAIFESVLPVVSAVGHEIDFTIADFVADARAATPSAAAEIITEDVFASREFVAAAPAILNQLARQHRTALADDFDSTSRRLARLHPRRRLNESLQLFDDLLVSLVRCVERGARQQCAVWQNLVERLLRARPVAILKQRGGELKQHRLRLDELARTHLRGIEDELTALEAKLRLLGPEQVLARGYSITTDAATGKVLRDATKVQAGQRLRTRLKEGEVESRVEP